MVRITRDSGFGICLIGKEYAGSYYLMHHGVKGQKHGVRQWQNKDGSYTPEGYQHYKEMYGWGEKKQKKSVSDISSNGKNLEYVSTVEQQRNTVTSETRFENNAFAAASDKKIRKAVIRAIDQTPDGKPSEEARVVFDSLRHYQAVYDEYADYSDKDIRGDGAEFHNKLMRQHPDYKQASDDLDRSISNLVKKVIDYSKSPSFNKIKGIEKYADFFDKIIDPHTQKPWYRVGNVKAFVIASILSEAVDEGYILPQMFIESFDSQGERLSSLYLVE